MRSSRAFGLLTIATGLAFLPLLGEGFEFLSWDDTTNIVHQPLVNTWSGEHLLAAWSAVSLGVYEPLGITLKAVIVRLFGMHVQPFQLVTLALHVANACLVFALARRLLALCSADLRVGLRPDAGALVAAGLFALHPMRVEVVAWASGQSYALAGSFFLLSLYAYLCYCELSREARASARAMGLLALSALAYLCAVLSKSSAVSLPAVLLLLDYYPLRRRLDGRLLIEKLPHFALGAALSVVIVRATAGAQGDNPFDLDLPARIAYALHSLLFHLGKTLWPAELLPSYTLLRAVVTPLAGSLLLYSAGVVALCALAWCWRGRAPWFAAAWGIYLVGMLPVSGLLAHGAWVLGADRYTYLTLFGLWISLGAVLTSRWLVPRATFSDPRSRVAMTGLLVLLAVWGISTHRQLQHWRDTEALWAYTLERDPANPTALNNLGFHFLERERYEEAIPMLTTAVAVEPGNLRALLNLGFSLEKLGRLEEGLHIYRRGLLHHPKAGALHNNIGVVYGKLGQLEKAEEHARRAKELGFSR
jgi:tetratricopeptide (TPR) repeat protein